MSRPTTKLRRLIHDFAAAQVADSWKGSEPPEIRVEISARLELTKLRLYEALNKLDERLSEKEKQS